MLSTRFARALIAAQNIVQIARLPAISIIVHLHQDGEICIVRDANHGRIGIVTDVALAVLNAHPLGNQVRHAIQVEAQRDHAGRVPIHVVSEDHGRTFMRLRGDLRMNHGVPAVTNISDFSRAVRHSFGGLFTLSDGGQLAEIREVLDGWQTQRRQNGIAYDGECEQDEQRYGCDSRDTDHASKSCPAAASRIVKYERALHKGLSFI